MNILYCLIRSNIRRVDDLTITLQHRHWNRAARLYRGYLIDETPFSTDILDRFWNRSVKLDVFVGCARNALRTVF